MYSRSVLLLLIFLLGGALEAQTKAWFQYENESGEVLSLSEHMAAAKVPGLSLCVMTGLEVDTLLTLGVRDVATQAPVDAETKFLVGGMAGALTNFLVLRSITLGKIALDAPANDYLKGWRLPEKGLQKRHPVTVRDLLLHSRRFNLGYKPQGAWEGEALPSLDQLLRGMPPATNKPLQLLRGTNKGGNSSVANFLILHAMLEDAWGDPFEVLVQRELLQPLGMVNSIWKSAPTEAELGNAAMGHGQDGTAMPGRYLRYAEVSHSGLWTTPEDYARFAAQLFAAADGADGALISRDLALQGTTPQFKDRSFVFFKAYDLFWGGASKGFYCNFIGKPENGTIITIFINSDLNWQFSNSVAGMAWDYARSKTN